MVSIEINNLSKNYGKKAAVKDLNLQVNSGELLGFLGVNGAGKTTTIKMLSCLTRPTSGDAKLNGYSILTDFEKVKSIIGVSPQETAIAPNLTVRENLELMAGVHGMSKNEVKERTDEMISTFFLEKVAKQHSKTLSGGWQRRLSIAMALISKPDILFLDEPTLGLDVVARRELWNTIGKLKGKVTIMLTTHYLEEAEALSDRICIMKDGELAACGTVSELNETAGCSKFEDTFIKFVMEGDENYENSGICK